MSTTARISIRFLGIATALSILLAISTHTPLSAQSGLPSQPNNLDALVQQALQEADAGKSDEAIRDLKTVLSSRPDWKEGWWNLGMLEYSANRFSNAEAAFLKVSTYAPDLGAAWALLGLSEFENGHFDNALTHLEEARTRGIPDDPEIERVALYHLALLRIRAGDFERAAEFLRTAFGSQSPSSQVKFAMGLALLRIPLLPTQIRPDREGSILSTGSAAFAGAAASDAFQSLLKAYPDLPYLPMAAAQNALDSGDADRAIQLLDRELALSPQSPLPWIEISRIESRRGHPEAALQSARKALALDPESRSAHLALATAWQQAGHNAEALQERQSAAELPFNSRPTESRILALYDKQSGPSDARSEPDSHSALWSGAMQEYTHAQYAAAARDLEAWLRFSPEDGTGWAVLGLCDYAGKDYDNALIHLERGARIGLSGSAESLQLARVTYGALLVRAARFDEATEVLASAHATGSLADQAEAASGLALLRRTELPESTTQSSALVHAAGKLAMLLEQSKYDEALAGFDQLLRQYPSTPWLHYAYGTALLALSEFDRAAALMQSERTISPKSELPLIRLASISLRQHAAQAAADWAARALAIAPDSVEGHYLLGRAALESGDTQIALRELQAACKLSPESPEIHFNLAKAYAHAKMPERAQQERNTFAELNARLESQRSQNGSQIYAGPHNTQDLTRSPAQPHAQ